ncbi:Positive alginate biosynthesis regulatory protein [Gammaproteobacteria bacterium]
MRVLVADDEAPGRERMIRLVGEMGAPYQLVAVAGDGEAAWRACLQGIDIALLDIRMPGADGLEVAARLTTLPVPPTVIFVTAYGEFALAAFERMAADYLLKPVRRERLAQALQRACALRGLVAPTPMPMVADEEEDETGRFRVSYRGMVQWLALREIRYFRAEEKYVLARHLQGEALMDESLRQLETQLGHRVLRVHRNALAVRRWIEVLDRAPDGSHWLRFQGIQEPLEVSRRHLVVVRARLKDLPVLSRRPP